MRSNGAAASVRGEILTALRLPDRREIGIFARTVVAESRIAPPPIVDDRVWQRSALPLSGRLIRYGAAATGALIGGIVGGVAGIVMFVVAAAPVLVVPVIVAAKLRSITAELVGGDGRAIARLHTLRELPWLRHFAPNAWAPAQEARLQLALGNGKAAARAFADVERLTAERDDESLTLARAHAHLLVAERKEALALLEPLAERGRLSDRGKFVLAVAYLGDGSRAKLALPILEELADRIGDDPAHRVALLLARARFADPRLRTEDVATRVGELDLDAIAEDAVLADIVKRLRKLVRGGGESTRSKTKKHKAHRDPTAAHDVVADKPRKKTRRERKRDKRRAAKRAEPAKAPSTTSSGKGKHRDERERSEATSRERSTASTPSRAAAVATKPTVELEAKAGTRTVEVVPERASGPIASPRPRLEPMLGPTSEVGGAASRSPSAAAKPELGPALRPTPGPTRPIDAPRTVPQSTRAEQPTAVPVARVQPPALPSFSGPGLGRASTTPRRPVAAPRVIPPSGPSTSAHAASSPSPSNPSPPNPSPAVPAPPFAPGNGGLPPVPTVSTMRTFTAPKITASSIQSSTAAGIDDDWDAILGDGAEGSEPAS